MSVHVKACYKEGAGINENTSDYAFDAPTYVVHGNYCEVILNFFRRNTQGLGVSRANNPILDIETALTGAENREKHIQALNKSDVLRAAIWCYNRVKSLSINLVNYSERVPFASSTRGGRIEINIGGVNGEVWKANAENALQSLLESETKVLSLTTLGQLSLKRNIDGEVFTARVFSSATPKIRAALIESGGDTNLTWYQLQYAILHAEAPYYVDAATAETWVRQYDALAAVADEY